MHLNLTNCLEFNMCSLRFLFIVVSCACVAACNAADSFQRLADNVLDDLRSVFSDEPNISIQVAVHEALTAAAAAAGIPPILRACDVDFDAACPIGWTDAGDSASCLAPHLYDGPCDSRVDFGSLLPIDKLTKAAKCQAHLPCRGACEEDFEHACPADWQLDALGQCNAPIGYEGSCVTKKRFSGSSSADKKLFGNVCGVRWPCRQSLRNLLQVGRVALPGAFHDDCIPNYNALCPRGWKTEREQSCSAPLSYSGLCGYSVSPLSYTTQMKEAWAAVCSARWPCSGDAVAS